MFCSFLPYSQLLFNTNSSSGTASVCLPGWKHKADLSVELGTGAAPDGDEDAIVGMIFAVKAVENDSPRPHWYDEVKAWADGSATSFLRWNSVTKDPDHRLLKLGSCWGGWDGNGQNPSYHSPGSFKIMRDFQATITNRDYQLPDFERPGLTLTQNWNQLIETSYDVLAATQCPNVGSVPNWATIGLDGTTGGLSTFGQPFSGSGTPEKEFGAEASRTMWRVALDAAVYPEEMNTDAMPFMDPVISSLDTGYRPNMSFNEKYWDSQTVSVDTGVSFRAPLFSFDLTFGRCTQFTDCYPPNYSSPVYSFSGGWVWNAFIYAPVVSSLVVPSASSVSEVDQQAMIDSAGSVLAQNMPTDYYARSWTLLGILMINGAVESAGKKLNMPQGPTNSPITAAPIPPTNAPITLAPVPTNAPIPTPTLPPVPDPTQAPPTDGIPFPCCSWNENSCGQPENEWCHSTQERCEASCNGEYLVGDNTPDTPTPAPKQSSSPVAAPPTDIPTTGEACCSDDFKRCINWPCNGCNDSEEKCNTAGYYWIPWGIPVDPESCIAITYSCIGHGKPCCPGMECNNGNGPCVISSSPPVTTPTPPPVTMTEPPTTAAPSPSPSDVPSPSPSDVPSPSLSGLPSVVPDSCDDDPLFTFLHDGKVKHCNWIEGKNSRIKTYCVGEVLEKCEESCGLTCSDNCADDSTAIFNLGNKQNKTCAWIATKGRQSDYCTPDFEAWSACPDLCDNCPSDMSTCYDDTTAVFDVGSKRNKNCAWVLKQSSKAEICTNGIEVLCPHACGLCLPPSGTSVGGNDVFGRG